MKGKAASQRRTPSRVLHTGPVAPVDLDSASCVSAPEPECWECRSHLPVKTGREPVSLARGKVGWLSWVELDHVGAGDGSGLSLPPLRRPTFTQLAQGKFLSHLILRCWQSTHARMRGGFCGTLAVVPVPVPVPVPWAETDAAVDAAGEELVEVAAVTPVREAISRRVRIEPAQCRLVY